jgi:hypothetical protein
MGMRFPNGILAWNKAPPPSEPQIAVDGAQPRRSGATVAVEFVGIGSYCQLLLQAVRRASRASPVDMAAAPMCRWLISSVGLAWVCRLKNVFFWACGNY